MTVAASGTDDRSGIESCTTVTLANEGAGQSATVSCTDKAGNTAPATVSGINIDKTAPEAYNQFDPATLDLKVVGRDGGSGVESVVLVSSVPVKWGDGEDEDEKQDKGNAELRTYKVTDRAGNTLTLVEKAKKAGHEIKARVISLQYNGGPVIAAPKNKKSFEWSLNKDGSLKELEEKLEVGQGKDKQTLQAKYEDKKRETTTIKSKDGEPDKKVTLPGLVLLRMVTDNGVLVLEY